MRLWLRRLRLRRLRLGLGLRGLRLGGLLGLRRLLPGGDVAERQPPRRAEGWQGRQLRTRQLVICGEGSEGRVASAGEDAGWGAGGAGTGAAVDDRRQTAPHTALASPPGGNPSSRKANGDNREVPLLTERKGDLFQSVHLFFFLLCADVTSTASILRKERGGKEGRCAPAAHVAETAPPRPLVRPPPRRPPPARGAAAPTARRGRQPRRAARGQPRSARPLPTRWRSLFPEASVAVRKAMFAGSQNKPP